ncbi:MAG: hypothetical protein JJ900_09705 [Rhodospirillales bacterium]|nr:hypothetical protein [Rhodospirillales bacterium]MBO6787114.1 hypothetical protein [Rhodospirillales bacterium]
MMGARYRFNHTGGNDCLSVKRFRLLTSAAALLLLTSCDAANTPFGLQLQALNDTGPQEPAVITIGDPQIYKRETLVNDRLREAKLIEALLDESAKIDGAEDFRTRFVPDLVRDTVTITSVATQLRAAFDPSQGRIAKRADRLADLEYQIRETELRAELETAKKALEDARAAKGDSGDDSDKGDAGQTTTTTNAPQLPDGATGSTTTTTTTTTTQSVEQSEVVDSSSSGSGNGDDNSQNNNNGATPGSPSLPSVDAIIVRAEKAYAKAKSELDTLVDRAKAQGRLVAQTGVKGSPTDQFRDLQAYRAELRQELAALNLDDLHDHGGNAFYRLQHLATVMPGRHKDKLGVGRLTFLPPTITQADINDLYYAWLNHLTYRMNPPLPGGREKQFDRRFFNLESSGLIKVERISVEELLSRPECLRAQKGTVIPENPDLKRQTILIAAHPSSANASWNNALRRSQLIQILAEESDSRYASYLQTCADLPIGDDLKRPDAPDGFKNLLSAEFNGHKRNITNGENSASGLGNRDITPPSSDDPKTPIPPTLVKVEDPVIENGAWQDGTNKRIALGQTYTYNVRPKEIAQRVSTLTRNANSMEFAMSLAASFPTKGLAGQFNSAFMRTAAGNAEALERLNLVVGFVDRRAPVERLQKAVDPVYLSDYQAPQAGWVFAPPASLNPGAGKLERRHVVKNHPVAVDISAPAWWPRMRVLKETAWVGNWHNTSRTIRLSEEPGEGHHQEWYEVPLPWQKRPNLDALTDLVMSKAAGGAVKLTQIRHFEPYYINACLPKVTVVIEGANIWRSTEAYLAGVPAEDIRVLPDMEGVAVTFNLDKLFESTNSAVLFGGMTQGLPSPSGPATVRLPKPSASMDHAAQAASASRRALPHSRTSTTILRSSRSARRDSSHAMHRPPSSSKPDRAKRDRPSSS